MGFLASDRRGGGGGGMGGILAGVDWGVFLALVREWKVVLPELGQSFGAVRCYHQI